MCKDEVYVFAPELGTASWSCIVSERNNAEARFLVSSVQLLGAEKLNLHFEHSFLSPAKSDAENNKFIEDLAKILTSVGAIDNKADVIKPTPVAQNIVAIYEIPEVPISKVDTLTSAIAKVCKEAIIMLSMPM
jgi:hypothetical protein